MEYLGRLINVSEEEIQMATTKKTESKEKVVKAKPAAKPIKEKVVKAKPAKPVKEKVSKTEAKVKKPSASQMFQELIMEGKLSDDKIFEKVQKEYGLDDNKKSYVKWYRNNLRKQGMNPPDAVGA